MYKGILDGQASAGRFLELLAGSKDEAVQASAGKRQMLCLHGVLWLHVVPWLHAVLHAGPCAGLFR